MGESDRERGRDGIIIGYVTSERSEERIQACEELTCKSSVVSVSEKTKQLVPESVLRHSCIVFVLFLFFIRQVPQWFDVFVF